ncbi:MAG TPA: hypothetical protein VGC90_07975 [Candidatus Limnocylindrales bacterium]
MDFYPWIVLVHVASAFVFVFAHGVSAFAAYRIRDERDPARIRAYLELSSSGVQTMYAAFALMVLAGIAGGLTRNWFAQGWIWAAIGVLLLVMFAMYGLASRYYGTVREAVGLPSSMRRKGTEPPPPATADELAVLLRSWRPDAIAGIGFIGLLIIIWLMVVKPF